MASSSSGQQPHSSPPWLHNSSTSRRIRHIVSLHVRSFITTTLQAKGSDAQSPHHSAQLYHVSLALSFNQPTEDSSQPFPFITEPSRPAVNADWSIDLGERARSCASSSKSIGGRSHVQVAAWAKKSLPQQQEEDAAAIWKCAWEREVDLNGLQRLPGGLSSSAAARLPPNSLILGLKSSVWSGSTDRSEHNALTKLERLDSKASPSQTQEVAKVAQQRLAANDHRARDAVTYYLVPDSAATDVVEQTGAAQPARPTKRRSMGEVDVDIGDNSILSGAASDPEEGSDTSSDEGGESQRDTGYDSETTFELSSSLSASSQIGTSSAKAGPSRPGLDRRRSSSRTIRAIKKGRRRKGTSNSKAAVGTDVEEESLGQPTGDSSKGHARKHSATLSSSSASKKSQDRREQVQRWQLEREREKEVLERSKWETRMLQGYDREQLQTIVQGQSDVDATVREEQRARGKANQALLDETGVHALRRRGEHMRGGLSELQRTLEVESEGIKQLRHRIEEKKESLARRRARLDLLHRQRTEGADSPARELDQIAQFRSRLHNLDALTHNRRAHLLELLSLIYPLQLLDPSELLFSIGGCTLPNSPAAALSAPSRHNKIDEDEVAAALGFAAQLVLLVSAYLETPLHYDVAAGGSRAMVRDGISLMNGPRSFPLYSKGVEAYRFEYGVFLLNKNVEQLMNAHGLPVLDLRHLLPNLNNLLLTLSSPKAVPIPHTRGTSDGDHVTVGNGGPSVVGGGEGRGVEVGTKSTLSTASAASASSDSPNRRRGGYKVAGRGEMIVLPSKPRTTDEGSGTADGEGMKAEGGPKTTNGAAAPMPESDSASHKKSVTKYSPSPAASWTASLLGWTGGGSGSRVKAGAKSEVPNSQPAPQPGNLPTARMLGGRQ